MVVGVEDAEVRDVAEAIADAAAAAAEGLTNVVIGGKDAELREAVEAFADVFADAFADAFADVFADAFADAFAYAAATAEGLTNVFFGDAGADAGRRIADGKSF